MPAFKRILDGYRSILGGFFRFVLLLALCLGAGLAVSFPAWKLAVTKPEAFTVVFLLIVAAAAAFFFARYFMRKWRENPRLLVLRTAGNLFLCAGLILFVTQVYARNLAAGFALLVSAIIAYGIFHFGLGETKKASAAEIPSGETGDD